jgi:Rhs element Vgr protein
MTVTTTILSDSKPIDPRYEIVSVDVLKEANRIPHAQLILIDGNAAQRRFAISDADAFRPGKLIEIGVRYEGDPATKATLFRGYVVAQRVEATSRRSLLTVELKDAALKLTLTRKSAVYRNQKDADVVAAIIKRNGLKQGQIEPTIPEHRELVQYYCSDWDFMLMRAEANGLLVVADDGTLSLRKPDLSGAARQTFEYGMSEIYDFEIEADLGDQYRDVQGVAWDITNQGPSQAARAKKATLAPGNLSGAELTTTLGVDPTTLTSMTPLAPAELQAWADGTLARSRLALLRGRIGSAGTGRLKLLDVIQIAGIGERFNGKALVTGIRHRIDQGGWRSDVQFGLSAERFAERPQIVDPPAAGLLPGVHGLQIGIVDQFQEDPDNQLRVRVILPTTGAVWARLASLEAGNNRGLFFPPEVGDEVVLGFINADPRQAVILGSLYSQHNAPPAEFAQLSAEGKKRAIVTRMGTVIGFLDDEKSALFIQTPSLNQIRLDDKAQSIQISDQHGNQIVMGKGGIQIKSSENVVIEGKRVDLK